ncbi:MAG: MAPEG family protein [Rhodobacteraceae bacterium]|nr:MAPEG family protein [Paracoccaceae bacterium]
MLSVTPIYAGLLVLMLIVLSIRVISLRRRLWVPLGHENNEFLLRRQRIQQNFIEYVPLALILMLCLELQGASHWALHGLGIALVTGRLFHAFGLSRIPENFTYRTIGMSLTFLVLAISALYTIYLAVRSAPLAG